MLFFVLSLVFLLVRSEFKANIEIANWSDCSPQRRNANAAYQSDVTNMYVSSLEPKVGDVFCSRVKGKIIKAGTLKKLTTPKSSVQMYRYIDNNDGTFDQKKFSSPYPFQLCKSSDATSVVKYKDSNDEVQVRNRQCPVYEEDEFETEVCQTIPRQLSGWIPKDGCYRMGLHSTTMQGSYEVGCINFDICVRK